MKPLITAQQISKFAEFGWIEFEQFFPPKVCENLRAAHEAVLLKRLKTDLKKLSRYSAETLYLEGRDCWRDAPELLAVLSRGNLPSAAANLTGQKLLLLAYDQWIEAGQTFLPQQLQSHCSFQHLACAVTILLEGENAGSVRFFAPHRFPFWSSAQLLVAYGTPNSVYFHNPLDPSNASLKRFGYNFGDRIKPESHPLCKT